MASIELKYVNTIRGDSGVVKAQAGNLVQPEGESGPLPHGRLLNKIDKQILT
jgi:hypothetical protein